jgi:hypothetical protein
MALEGIHCIENVVADLADFGVRSGRCMDEVGDRTDISKYLAALVNPVDLKSGLVGLTEF